jgi:hypothetical protein
MTRTLVMALDIEDYYGTALENINFEFPLELDPEEFSVRVDDFNFAGSGVEDGEVLIRIQYNHEFPSGDFEKMTEIHLQIMEMLMEGCDGELPDSEEVSSKILQALEIIV